MIKHASNLNNVEMFEQKYVNFNERWKPKGIKWYSPSGQKNKSISSLVYGCLTSSVVWLERRRRRVGQLIFLESDI